MGKHTLGGRETSDKESSFLVRPSPHLWTEKRNISSFRVFKSSRASDQTCLNDDLLQGPRACTLGVRARATEEASAPPDQIESFSHSLRKREGYVIQRRRIAHVTVRWTLRDVTMERMHSSRAGYAGGHSVADGAIPPFLERESCATVRATRSMTPKETPWAKLLLI